MTNHSLDNHPSAALTKQDWAWWDSLDNLWKKIFTAHIYYKHKIEFDGLLRWSYNPIDGWGLLNLANPQDLQRVLQLDDIYCTGFGSLLADIRPLAKLTHSSTLDMDGGEIQDISPLAQLPYLTEISLKENQIQDISALKNLKQLTELYLDDNRIECIDVLADLTQLNKMSLVNNPLTKTQIDELQKQLPSCKIVFK